MGIAGIGIWQLLIVLAIAFLLFGSGRLRNLGGDLGTAIRGFRNAVREDVETAVQVTHAEPESKQTAAAGPE